MTTDLSSPSWHVHVDDWDGHTIYDGPAPVPEGLAEITLEDLAAGRVYAFTMTALD